MTGLSRGAAGRRSGRRPVWLLLSALLFLAIGASSALVFTNRVELLRLAVILALWAAVVAAFVSVSYRRQADVDQARARDLKLVYDLQLDREISARREYELTVESQLRRELTAELGAAAADEVATLRAELTALRTSLEIFFDTDLDRRPALETDGAAARGYPELTDSQDTSADWVSSDRVASVRQHDAARHSEETAIIDVPEEPLVGFRQTTGDSAAGAVVPPVRHDADAYRASSEQPQDNGGRPVERRRQRRREHGRRGHSEATPPPQQEVPRPAPEPRVPASDGGTPPQPEPQPPGWPGRPAKPAAHAAEWEPGSGQHATRDSQSVESAARRGRHSDRAEAGRDGPDEAEPGRRHRERGRRARHSTEHRDDDTDVISTASSSPAPPWAPAASDVMSAAVATGARHRTTDSLGNGAALPGGESVADLLARLQAQTGGAGGRRRRRKV